ncbi:U3 small nucleolar ribonucleoprotein complex, subunit Mpp10 [Mrakia frigida]|uniref:U3 small nucleolar ribonucleoprotein complex, subunit Mpp10 n=1 Tax=Mrakia frigida TaxID=29902 RepID=UPI003FCBFC9A
MATLDSAPTSFTTLTSLLDTSAHGFASPSGDSSLAAASELALKDVFDLALSTESTLLPHIRTLLLSLLPADLSSLPAEALDRLNFPPTPLTSLYTDGMDVDQIWEQLEMRAGKMVEVLDEVGVLDELDREEGSISNEEREQRGMGPKEDSESDGEEGSEELSFEGMDELEDSGESESEEEEEEEEEGVSFADEEDDDEDDDDDDEEMMDDEEEEEEEEEDEDDDTERRVTDLDQPGSSSASKRSHPTLDDPFFSLHAFNRETEELEAFEVSDGKLGLNNDDDDDDEEDDDEEDMEALLNSGGKKEVDMWRSVEGDGEGGTDEVKYSDFFAPPAKVYKPAAVPGSSQKSSKGKGRAKALPTPSFDDMEDDDDDMMGEDQGDDEEEFNEGDYDDFEDEEDDLLDLDEDGTDVTSRAKGDLFAEEEEDEDDAAPLSTHAARLALLSQQIKALEDENVGVKPWALAGEAGSKSRPINAILEEDLEFENVGKQVPVVTEEKVKGLEDKIKQRILDNDFNDVLRRRALDAKPFLPSRVFELQDQQSTKSLAQIYEDEYTASSSKVSGGAGPPIDDRDGKLKKEHEEIEKTWGEICYKLDSLSNANFTPKQPKAQIQTLTNLATLSLETALPPSQRASHLLAPEEVFQPPSASDLRSKSEMTPTEKRVARGKEKKFKRKQRDRLEGAVDKFDKFKNGRKGAKGEKGAKEEALKGLVKEGRGVTIIGKDAKKFDKKGKRDVVPISQSGTKFKL